MLHKGSRHIRTLRKGGRTLTLLVKNGRQIYPGKRADLPPLLVRITEENGANGLEKWFEVGWVSPELLDGDAATGLTDARGIALMEFWRSEDMQTWSDGEFVDCADSPVANADGTWTYWARSVFPIDSALKSGTVIIEQFSTADARNAPITGITLNGEVQDLPNFPYVMPTDAALLQTDLRAEGWTGALVTATSAVAWRIEIVNATMTTYTAAWNVYWPGYLVENNLGELVNICDHRSVTDFSFVNQANVRTSIRHQFSRMHVTCPAP